MKATLIMKLEDGKDAVDITMMEMMLNVPPEEFQDTLKRNVATQMPHFMTQAFEQLEAAGVKREAEEAKAAKEKAEAEAKAAKDKVAAQEKADAKGAKKSEDKKEPVEDDTDKEG